MSETYTEKLKNSSKVVKEATDEDVYVYMHNRFKKGVARSSVMSGMLIRHIAVEIFTPLALCGSTVKVRGFGFIECRECKLRWTKAFIRYVHEEVLNKSPEKSLSEFVNLNDKALSSIEGMSEERAVIYISKHVVKNCFTS